MPSGPNATRTNPSGKFTEPDNKASPALMLECSFAGKVGWNSKASFHDTHRSQQGHYRMQSMSDEACFDFEKDLKPGLKGRYRCQVAPMLPDLILQGNSQSPKIRPDQF